MMFNLKEVVEKYPNSTNSRNHLISLLHVLYPTDKSTVNIVITVYDSGILEEIRSIEKINNQRKYAFVKRLVNEYGLQEQSASLGINLWLEAYGVTDAPDCVPQKEITTNTSVSGHLSRPGGELASRPLNIFYIVGCSGNMHGEKIGALNATLGSQIPDLTDVANEFPGINLQINILSFSSGAEWVTPKPVNIYDFFWKDLQAGGLVDLGEAYKMLAVRLEEMAKDARILPPVLILILGNSPTDNYQAAWKTLNSMTVFKRSTRVAIPIGVDADMTVLHQFTENPELILSPTQISYIPRIIKALFCS